MSPLANGPCFPRFMKWDLSQMKDSFSSIDLDKVKLVCMWPTLVKITHFVFLELTYKLKCQLHFLFLGLDTEMPTCRWKT